jgi:DNA-binding CsgD family transcriptional regulator
MLEANDFAGLPRMYPTDDRDERRLTAGLVGLFAVVAVLTAVDLATDVREGTWPRHVLIEGSVTLVGLVGAFWMVLRFRTISSRARRLAEHAQHLEQSLEASRYEAEKWRREAGDLIAGLSHAIDRQLERWGLSAAEKEVALLLLKGLSHKEIAGIRSVSEATVRQQATALYRKAGLEGRHDLAAFFLEDLP